MRFSSFLLLLTLLIGCIGIKDRFPTNVEYLFSLKAINLSEDRSNFSSKNDEVLFLLYEYRNGKPTKLVKEVYKEFDIINHHTDTSFQATISYGLDSFAFAMIEIDEQVWDTNYVHIIRDHYSVLHKAIKNKNLKRISTYLNDDDLLVLAAYPKPIKNLQYRINDSHKLDKYEYTLNIQVN